MIRKSKCKAIVKPAATQLPLRGDSRGAEFEHVGELLVRVGIRLGPYLGIVGAGHALGKHVHVEAGAKRPAGAGHHDCADWRVAISVLHRLMHLGHHRDSHRVGARGAVESDARDIIRFLVDDLLELHNFRLLWSRAN
jgi:hypothetical protein